MDRESVSLSCVTRPAYFRRTTRRTIVGIVEMDGIFLFLGTERATSKGKWVMKINEERRETEGEGGSERVVRESG